MSVTGSEILAATVVRLGLWVSFQSSTEILHSAINGTNEWEGERLKICLCHSSVSSTGIVSYRIYGVRYHSKAGMEMSRAAYQQAREPFLFSGCLHIVQGIKGKALSLIPTLSVSKNGRKT